MVTLAIIIMLFLIGILRPKNSKISILGWIYLVWLSVTAPTDHLGDYSAYQLAYFDQINYQGVFEKGYTALEGASQYFDLSFDQFRGLFVGITILVLYLGVRRFTKNHALFLSLYMMTFYSQDLMQMRSQFMMAVVLFAYSLLIGKKSNKMSLTLATILIIVGAQIHSSGYLFIIGLILYASSENMNRIAKIALPLTLILTFIVPILFRNSLFVSIIGFLGRVSGRDDVLNNKIFSLFTSGTPFSLKVWYFIPLLIAWLVTLQIIKSIDNVNISENDNVKIRVLVSGVLIGFIGFALLSIAPDYSRIFRHGMTFFIVLLAYYFEESKGILTLKVRPLIITLALVPFIYISFYVTSITWGPIAQQSQPYILKIIN